MTDLTPGEKITVWISKYALGSGKLIEAEVTPREWDDGTTTVRTADGYTMHTLGREAFTDRADAVRAAAAMRVKKIASLKKQIAKLEKMDFNQ